MLKSIVSRSVLFLIGIFYLVLVFINKNSIDYIFLLVVIIYIIKNIIERFRK